MEKGGPIDRVPPRLFSFEDDFALIVISSSGTLKNLLNSLTTQNSKSELHRNSLVEKECSWIDSSLN